MMSVPDTSGSQLALPLQTQKTHVNRDETDVTVGVARLAGCGLHPLQLEKDHWGAEFTTTPGVCCLDPWLIDVLIDVLRLPDYQDTPFFVSDPCFAYAKHPLHVIHEKPGGQGYLGWGCWPGRVGT